MIHQIRYERLRSGYQHRYHDGSCRSHMREGFDGLANLVQDHLRGDPFSGQAFVFLGRRVG